MPKKKAVKPKEEDLEFEIEENVGDVGFKLPQPESMPSRIDPKWSDYVLSQLAEDEKQGDYPKTDGLRRLVNLLIGPIIRTDVEVVNCPSYGQANHNDNTSTIKVSLQIHDKELNRDIVYSSCADASTIGMEAPYSYYLSAIAETRAEGRAYRKVLGLKNIITADEAPREPKSGVNTGPVGVSAPLTDDKVRITKAQIQWLKKECESKDINVQKFLSSVLSRELTTIGDVLRSEARNLGEQVSNFKKEGAVIPASYKGFVSDEAFFKN